jgi:hypothetical protein
VVSDFKNATVLIRHACVHVAISSDYCLPAANMRVSGLVRLIFLEFLAFGRPIKSTVFNSAGLAALDRLREVMGAVSRRDELKENAICSAGCRR